MRYDPNHGRSVLLYRDEDVSSMHAELMHTHKLLERAGGYWWDGRNWHRPNQIFDWTKEEYLARKVPAVVTVTAADLLPDEGSIENLPALAGRRPTLRQFVDQDGKASIAPTAWTADLASWAEQHQQQPDARELSQCIVNLSAPELSGDQLLDLNSMAERAGIAASTLRSYLSRSQGDVPAPQQVIGGRDMWSLPVVDDWILQRKNDDAGSTRSRGTTDLPVGVTAIQQIYRRRFLAQLWDNSTLRKRWALRWRSQESVQEVADDLAWRVAGSIDDVVRVQDVRATVATALIGAFQKEIEETRRTSIIDGDEVQVTYHLDPVLPAYLRPELVRMLTWLLRLDGDRAMSAITEAALDLNLIYRGELPETADDEYLNEYVRRTLKFALLLTDRVDERDQEQFAGILNAAFPGLPSVVQQTQDEKAEA